MTNLFADIGACTVAFVAAWIVRLATSRVTGSWFPIRERRRRRLEADLRQRSHCRNCGAVGAVRFAEPDADAIAALRATFAYFDRVRQP